jgi:hypothetical protein
MTPQEFIAKWQRSRLSERSACQQHFLDLCELLGQPKPAAADEILHFNGGLLADSDVVKLTPREIERSMPVSNPLVMT